MSSQGFGQELQPLALQASAEVCGGVQELEGDKSAAVPNRYDDTLRKMEVALEDARKTLNNDTLSKMEMVLEDDKQALADVEDEDRIDKPESKDRDDAQVLDIRTNSNPVWYTLTDEANEASKSKKKTKKNLEEDLLVAAIKKALGDEHSVADSSMFYTVDELANLASSTVGSSSSYTRNSYSSDIEGTAAASFADTSLKGRRSASKDESTVDVTASLDEETLLSDFTENTPMASFPNLFMCTPSPEMRTKRPFHFQSGTVQSITSEPPYLEDEHDYEYDDDISYDNTYATEGTAGFVRNILSCGTYSCGVHSLCFGDEKEYKPKVGKPKQIIISNKETRRGEDSAVATSTPLTVKERLSKARSKTNYVDAAIEAALAGNKEEPLTVKERLSETRSKNNFVDTAIEAALAVKKEEASTVKERLSKTGSKDTFVDTAIETELTVNKEEGIFQEESNVNAISETLDNTFWKGDGVFSDDSSNDSDDNDEVNDSLRQSPSVTNKASDKSSPTTSGGSIASSSKKMKPYLLRRAVKSHIPSLSFRKQKSLATQQLPVETDVHDDGMTTAAILSSVPTTPDKKLGIDVVQDNPEQPTTDQSKNQGYEVPLEQSLHQMTLSKSSSGESITKSSTAENHASTKNPTSPTRAQTLASTSEKNLETPSPARTVETSVSTDSSRSDPELSAIVAKKWKSVFDKVSGKTYYYNKLTGSVQWEVPDGFVAQKGPSTLWKAAVDVTTGLTYYYNRQTKEVTWEVPDGFVAQKRPSTLWKEAFDATTGLKYYYNRQTKEVTWDKPHDLVTA